MNIPNSKARGTLEVWFKGSISNTTSSGSRTTSFITLLVGGSHSYYLWFDTAGYVKMSGLDPFTAPTTSTILNSYISNTTWNFFSLAVASYNTYATTEACTYIFNIYHWASTNPANATLEDQWTAAGSCLANIGNQMYNNYNSGVLTYRIGRHMKGEIAEVTFYNNFKVKRDATKAAAAGM